jgi:hypothetical protein
LPVFHGPTSPRIWCRRIRNQRIVYHDFGDGPLKVPSTGQINTVKLTFLCFNQLPFFAFNQLPFSSQLALDMTQKGTIPLIGYAPKVLILLSQNLTREPSISFLSLVRPGENVLINRDCSAIGRLPQTTCADCARCSGDFLPPSPLAEKATYRQDQTRQSCATGVAPAMKDADAVPRGMPGRQPRR